MDAKLVSEETPSSVYTGRLWIKPSTMTAYLRMGSDWIPIASGSAFTTYDDVTIFINGIDRTSLVEKNSLEIADILTQEVNTASFTIIDESKTAAYKPAVGQEVMIFYRETIASTPTLMFAGRINEAPQSRRSKKVYSYEVTCVDYTSELMRNLVVESYTAKTAGYIIRDIVGSYAHGVGTFFVEEGETIDYISFNYKYPMDCISELASLIGYDWYVDYDKNIHFFPPTTNTAPYSLTDNLADGEYGELEIAVDKSSLRNKQVVRGGYQYSELFTEEQIADGLQTSFNLKYEPFSPVSVYIDSGAGYVAHTLGVDNIDSSGYDFVVNQSEKNIKNLDHASLSAGHKLKVTYKYKIPILAQVEDAVSQALMQSYEGGDGVYEGELIVDDTIETKAAARTRARAETDQYANPLIEGSFSTLQSGYRSGQLLTVNIPSRGYNSTYLIREVTATSLGMGIFRYEVTFATRLKGLTEFLVELFNAGKKIFERTDEILDTLKVIEEDDIITLSDITPTYEIRDIVSVPYVWCNDAGTTVGKGRWNVAEYA